MKTITAYHLVQIDISPKKQFLFESIGNKTITKAIEYTPFTTIDQRTVYNLGFGDFDPATNTVSDNVNSNNGDMYKVFNTVLSTVLLFFQTNPNDMIFVQGGDKRRRRIYCYYIDKNYTVLSEEYQIFGGTTTKLSFYKIGVEYDYLLIHRKN